MVLGIEEAYILLKDKFVFSWFILRRKPHYGVVMAESNVSFPGPQQNTSISFHSFEELAALTLPYLLKGNIALSGGSTYGRLLPLWAGLSPDCRAATFFPVDERIVDFDDPSSNWGTIYRQFLLQIGKSEDKANFAASADAYRDLLKSHFQAEMPMFDVVFLGVGDDGHTASLFPGENHLDDLGSVILETTSPKPPFRRVTLGLGPLIAAKTLIAVIAGKEKKHIAAKIFTKDETLPISKVFSRRKNSLLFVEDSLLY
jgi:6-phosphogluconolactonase